MEPSSISASSATSAAASAASAATDRFRAILATQLAALEVALARACELEAAKAATEAVEAAAQAARAYPPSAAEPSRVRDNGSNESAAGKPFDFTFQPRPRAVTHTGAHEPPCADAHADNVSHPQAEQLSSMPIVTRATSSTDAHSDVATHTHVERPIATPAAAGTAASSHPKLCSSPKVTAFQKSPPPSKQVPPSRIPRPREPRVNAPGSSTTFEDLEDHRLLKLSSKKRSPTPRSCTRPSEQARSPTPTDRRPASTGRTCRADDDSAVGVSRGGLKTRMMYDKRTLRRQKRDSFMDAILEWRTQHEPAFSASHDASPLACQVFVRLRPLFEKEKQQGEFEAVTAFGDNGEVVVHNCLFHADLARMFIHHLGFRFPRTFGPVVGNEPIFEEIGLPLVDHALSGHLSTLFMFGQTGSGKTYTMDAIIQNTSQKVATDLQLGITDSRDNTGTTLRVRAFEIAGKKCIDLLSRTRAELRLLDSEDGQTHVVGATEAEVSSAEGLLDSLREAFAARATASHGRNEESSRSHCVCILDVPTRGGSLVLVDCAGTERRQDTDQHSAERTRETAEINTSLHALKECIRYRSRELRHGTGNSNRDDARRDGFPVRVPYRGSQLTRVLHESFTRRGSRLFVIGTLAPAAMDTEHTLSTLRTLQLLSDAPSFEEKIDVDVLKGLPNTPGRTRSFKLASAGARPPIKRPQKQMIKVASAGAIGSNATSSTSATEPVDNVKSEINTVGIACMHAGSDSAEDMYSDDDFEAEDE